MSNPVFDAMGSMVSSSPMNMLQAFSEFKRTFQGDPKKQVEELLRTGKMSKQQFEQFSNMANQFSQLLGR